NQLSNIATTYGAAAAFLSVLALAGVAVSLIFQARETKANREQSLRVMHMDLMKLAMDDEMYRRCWGPDFSSDDPDEQRAQLYVNMIISHWRLMWELDAITEMHLRTIAAMVFQSDDGRVFWRDSRQARVMSAASRRERRLYDILDE